MGRGWPHCVKRHRGGAALVLWVCVLAGLLLPPPLRAQEPVELFDGRTLEGWKIADLGGGEGAVQVRDGRILLGSGEPMTGITWAGKFPPIDYEVKLEAMRLEGTDFFSAVTFPVGEAACTLVVGGWGGGVVGLSSIAGADASENETRRFMEFEDDRWYRIRLRVTREKIEAWIDEEKVVDFVHVGRLLSLRVEVWGNRPFGIATWNTAAALRGIELRKLREGPGGS
jgi:Domain of Unknown Function (DUF1080)